MKMNWNVCEVLHHQVFIFFSIIVSCYWYWIAHVNENELAVMFRNNKFNVTLSAYSFELLLNFLNDARFMLLLSIVNQYLSIKVVQGRYYWNCWLLNNRIEISKSFITRPGDRAREGISRTEAPLTGRTEHEIAQLHAKEILWSLFEDKQEEEEVCSIYTAVCFFFPTPI